MSCAICFDNTKDPFTTSCGHIFCNKCIMTWVSQHNRCPLCRKKILDPVNDVEEEDVEEDVEDVVNYTVSINRNSLSKCGIDERKNIVKRIYDFIKSINKPDAIYLWREAIGGNLYTTIRKRNYYIELICYNKLNQSEGYENIYVSLSKRYFVKYIKKSKIHDKINKHRVYLGR